MTNTNWDRWEFPEHAPPKLTATRDFWNASAMRVDVQTNGPQGGDHGHGSRVIIRLTDLASTSWDVQIKKGRYEGDVPDAVELRFGGDAEGSVIIDALEYVTRMLRMEWGATGEC